MGLFEKENNWYIDYYVRGRRKREKTGPSKAQARVVLQKRKVEIAEGKFLDVRRNQRAEFEEMGKLFLENCSRPNRRSWRRDEEIVGHLVGFFKGKYLYEITSLDIKKYKRKRREEVLPATVNRELSGLSNMYNQAIEWGMAHKNPVKGVEFFREDEERARFLEKKEAKRLYDACPDYLEPVVALAVSTGMRKGEILSLKWLDVDFRRRIVTILKTKRQRKREIFDRRMDTIWTPKSNPFSSLHSDPTSRISVSHRDLKELLQENICYSALDKTFFCTNLYIDMSEIS